jgi:dihydrolipoamide dehydrogenase
MKIRGNNMQEKKYQYVVLGAGPGGYHIAIKLASLGNSVALIEKDEIGGVCLNKGCMPTKVLVTSAKKFYECENSSLYGVRAENISFDFNSFLNNKNEMISRIKKGLAYSIQKSGVELIKGKAFINDKNSICIDGSNEKIFFDNLIIAVGTSPSIPKEWMGIDGIYTSETFWNLNNLPKNITIIGGGVIGCEYASSLSILGYNINLIEKMDSILSREDSDVSSSLLRELKKRNVNVLLGKDIKSIKKENNNLVLDLENEKINTDIVIVCMGRENNLENLKLENVGLNKNDVFKTMNLKLSDNIWITGDIASGPMLAHKAYYDSDIILENILGKKTLPDYSDIPMAIYTNPEISRVGFTEKEAKEKYDITSVKCSFTQIGKAVVDNNTKGFLKLVVEKSSNKILGITIFGDYATELHGYSVLIMKNKITVNDLKKINFAHPTLGEVFQVAAEMVK